jgi:hypothetical protein
VFMIGQHGPCQLGQITSCNLPSVVPSAGLVGGPGRIPVRDDPVLYTGPSQTRSGALRQAN